MDYSPSSNAKVKNDELLLVVAFMVCRQRFIYTKYYINKQTFVTVVRWEERWLQYLTEEGLQSMCAGIKMTQFVRVIYISGLNF